MSTLHLILHLKHVLENLTWGEGADELVYGPNDGVLIPSHFLIDDEQEEAADFPYCVLGVDTADHDDEDPDLVVERVRLAIATLAEGGPYGQEALTGGARKSDATQGRGSSEGRGILELERVTLGAIRDLASDLGISISIDDSAKARPSRMGPASYLMAREYTIVAVLSRENYYPSPYDLVATDSGGGAAALTWKLPTQRYDFREVRLIRKAGGSPPTSVTDGDEVDLASSTSTSHTDNPGAGEFSYALFSAYTDTGAAENQIHSEQETGTTRTVTVTA